jgi:hypothetical protein
MDRPAKTPVLFREPGQPVNGLGYAGISFFQLCGGSESHVSQGLAGWVLERTGSFQNGVVFLERLLFAAQTVKCLRYGKYGFGVTIQLTELVEIPEGFREVASLEIHLVQQTERFQMIRAEGESFLASRAAPGKSPCLRFLLAMSIQMSASWRFNTRRSWARRSLISRFRFSSRRASATLFQE